MTIWINPRTETYHLDRDCAPDDARRAASTAAGDRDACSRCVDESTAEALAGADD